MRLNLFELIFDKLGLQKPDIQLNQKSNNSKKNKKHKSREPTQTGDNFALEQE